MAVAEWPCEVHVWCTCLEYVCDVAMCVDNTLLVVGGEVGCASWAVRFKVCVGEDSVWVEGYSIWASFVMGYGRKEKRVARRWCHLFCVYVERGLFLGSWGGGSVA